MYLIGMRKRWVWNRRLGWGRDISREQQTDLVSAAR
jgi:hypothetical protein